MTTGLEDEETTYVESNPAENFASLRLKNRELHLDEKKKQELLALAPGDEKADLTPKVGKRTLKKTQKAEREKTKGDNWFGMKAPEVTEETRRELEVLQMRSALDPKRFYKKNDLKVLPKYFQVRTQVLQGQTFLNGYVSFLDRSGDRQSGGLLHGPDDEEGQEEESRGRAHGGRGVQEVQQAEVHGDHRGEGQAPAEIPGQGVEETKGQLK